MSKSDEIATAKHGTIYSKRHSDKSGSVANWFRNIGQLFAKSVNQLAKLANASATEPPLRNEHKSILLSIRCALACFELARQCLNQLCRRRCEIRENSIASGPLEGEQAFQNRLILVYPAALCSRRDHRIFA